MVYLQDHPNQYKVKKAISNSFASVPIDTVITLSNHSDSELLRVPDPRYIQLHAACAKIAHASGAAEVIDHFLSDYDTVKTLSADGSSSELLAQALGLVGS